MAANYDGNFLLPRDRVRFNVADKAAPYSFQDEEIYYLLTSNGYVGDPAVEGPKQEKPELLASIALIESTPSSSGSTGASITIKQGSVTRTSSDGSLGVRDRSGILKALYARLGALATRTTGGGGPAVVDGYACDFGTAIL